MTSVLYFSFFRMLSTKLAAHLFFPAGVGIPSLVRKLAMELVVLPLRNRL